MTAARRLTPGIIAAGLALVAGLILMATTHRAGAAGLGQLQSQLGAEQARSQTLSASITRLDGLISSLSSQIALVQGRETAVADALASDQAKLAAVGARLTRERARLAMLRRRLAFARILLARQLVSGYESQKPDLVSVVLSAHGFTDLLEQLDFLGRAEHQQQTIITLTRQARAQATAAATRLAALERTDRQVAQATALQAHALAGMNALLASRQGALAGARSAQQAALAAGQSRAHALRGQITQVKAAQAAAARAAAAAARAAALAAQRAAQQAASVPVALGPSGGWSIPYAIVLCESGGQNLPPNSAGASGYYQIIPGTWKLFGGTGPAAYLASKAEQDAVASRIWRGGAGASNWVCAGIVGIH